MFPSFRWVLALLLYIPLLAHCSPTVSSHHQRPPTLDPQKLRLVRKNAIEISTRSWELGVLAEALTELNCPHLGVFSHGSIPPPAHLKKGHARRCSRSPRKSSHTSPQLLPLMNDEQVSASLSCYTTRRTLTNRKRKSSRRQREAAGLLTADSAANVRRGYLHRAHEVQLWADNTAYEQVKLYRDVLFDRHVGLWRHIALGSGTDPKHWATGNAWAAAGALRVLATIQRSCVAKSMRAQQHHLKQWVREILDGAWRHQKPNGALPNYIDESASFSDASSTALLAATTFRYASITGNETHIPAAIRALKLVRDSVDSDGWLHGTVDPLTFSTRSKPGHYSPEGQSFVLLLEAAVSAWHSSHKH
ncbi:hypothetical protein BC826DRAFT_1031471 [Russula brevipes]|nr:hypothetical protein BC826DRAFT_1031471 [Russula brevipes]